MTASSERVFVGFVFSILSGFLAGISTVDESAEFFMWLAIPVSIIGGVMLTIGVIAKGVAIGVTESRERKSPKPKTAA